MDMLLRRTCVVCLTLAVVSPAAQALETCSLLTSIEASSLLGEPADDQTRSVDPAAAQCMIRAKSTPEDQVTLRLTTLSAEEAPRVLKHLEEARGDEIPSLHGDPWYQIAVADPGHPTLDHRFVIHRDRTSLTVDVRSVSQPDAKRAFEAIWLAVALRLPTDER